LPSITGSITPLIDNAGLRDADVLLHQPVEEAA